MKKPSPTSKAANSHAATLRPEADTLPASSWWDCDRATLQVRIKDNANRMRASRFGKASGVVAPGA